MSNISNTISSIYGRIAPAHRAIWRGDVIWWLSLVYLYACNPEKHTFDDLFIFIIIFLIFTVFNVAREYRYPHPDNLYISAPYAVKYTFSIVALVGTVLWAISLWFFREPAQWPWLLFALAATGAAYLLRPRLRS